MPRYGQADVDTGGQQVSVWINYRDTGPPQNPTHTIESWEWTGITNSGQSARFIIWDDDIDPNTPVYDETFTADGLQDLPPGANNYKLIDDPEDPGFLVTQPNIRYTIQVF